ncbi:hypothetical protein [Streptomyces sp. NPDC005955]|uniref:hypothetical protein n=1 Tax=Streptomyces sp. NPDC005955 TaxID=3364738 RepID=UPI00367A11D7
MRVLPDQALAEFFRMPGRPLRIRLLEVLRGGSAPVRAPLARLRPRVATGHPHHGGRSL